MRLYPEAHAKDYDNFALHYTVDRPPAAGWAYDKGFITVDMIRKHMPPPGKDTQILLCAPRAMMKFVVMSAIEKLGYTREIILQW
jgi:cytochrome-b5 reductase